MAHPSNPNENPRAARVALVAAGVVSPLGVGLSETLNSLRKAKDCVTPVKRFSVEQCRCKTAGQVPDHGFSGSGQKGHPSPRPHRASPLMIPAFKKDLVHGTS